MKISPQNNIYQEIYLYKLSGYLVLVHSLFQGYSGQIDRNLGYDYSKSVDLAEAVQDVWKNKRVAGRPSLLGGDQSVVVEEPL